jgi:hypothetical protein
VTEHDPNSAAKNVSSQVHEIIATAERAAEQLGREIEAEAARRAVAVLDEAHAEAAAVVDHAHAESAAIRDAAEGDAARRRGDAEAEAERIRSDAEAEAAGYLEGAQRHIDAFAGARTERIAALTDELMAGAEAIAPRVAEAAALQQELEALMTALTSAAATAAAETGRQPLRTERPRSPEAAEPPAADPGEHVRDVAANLPRRERGPRERRLPDHPTEDGS